MPVGFRRRVWDHVRTLAGGMTLWGVRVIPTMIIGVNYVS